MTLSKHASAPFCSTFLAVQEGMLEARGGLIITDHAHPAMPGQVFLEAVRLFLTQRGSDVGVASFDKDDALAVEFVTAAANLRALAYGIPAQTLFDIKVRAEWVGF